MDAGFQELVFEDALEMLAALAAAIGAGPPAGPLTHEALTSNLRDDTVSNMIVMLLRMVTSAELQARGRAGSAPAAPLSPSLSHLFLGAQLATAGPERIAQPPPSPSALVPPDDRPQRREEFFAPFIMGMYDESITARCGGASARARAHRLRVSRSSLARARSLARSLAA
jgi:hypothetical protein